MTFALFGDLIIVDFYQENFDDEKEKYLYYIQMIWCIYSCVTQAWIFLCALICICRTFNITEITLLKENRKVKISAYSFQHFAF